MIDRLISLLERMLGVSVGKEGAAYIRSAGAVTLGLLLAKAFNTLLYLFSGRVLPKAEFGNYALALSVGMFLIIPMLLGVDTAMSRFISRSKKRTGEYVTAAYVLIVIFLVVTSVTFYLLEGTLSDLTGIGEPTLGLALLLGVCMVVFFLVEKTLQGRQQMKVVGIVRAVCAISGSMAALVLILVFGRHFYFLGLGVAFGFAISGVLGILLLAKGSFEWASGKFVSRAKDLLKYGMFATLSGASSVVLYSFDKLLVGHYLGTEAVGTYFAYSLASMGGIGILVLGLTFALFPRISEKSRAQKRNAFFAMNRLVLRLVPLALVMIFIGQVVFLAVMGKYELRLDRLILFSIYGTLTSMTSVYSWFASSDKAWGIRSVGLTSFLAAVLFLGSSILWLHEFGIDGIVFAAILAFGLANVSYILFSRKIVRGSDRPGA